MPPTTGWHFLLNYWAVPEAFAIIFCNFILKVIFYSKKILMSALSKLILRHLSIILMLAIAAGLAFLAGVRGPLTYALQAFFWYGFLLAFFLFIAFIVSIVITIIIRISK